MYWWLNKCDQESERGVPLLDRACSKPISLPIFFLWAFAPYKWSSNRGVWISVLSCMLSLRPFWHYLVWSGALVMLWWTTLDWCMCCQIRRCEFVFLLSVYCDTISIDCQYKRNPTWKEGYGTLPSCFRQYSYNGNNARWLMTKLVLGLQKWGVSHFNWCEFQAQAISIYGPLPWQLLTNANYKSLVIHQCPIKYAHFHFNDSWTCESAQTESSWS